MQDVEIRPFSDDHLDAAAELLRERHERHLAAEPLLPRDVDYRAQVEGDLSNENATGAVALGGDRLAGYLIGRITEDDCLVDFAGFAGEAEVVRDLYAHVSAPWVEGGHVRHRVHVPAFDRGAVDAWFRLAFGRQLTFGVRETAAERPRQGDVTMRRAERRDLSSAVGLGQQLYDHQRLPPSYSARPSISDDEYREWWESTHDDQAFVHFVADRDGDIIGHLLLYRRPPDDLRIATTSIDLAHAVTLPGARGTGVGTALTRHALAWAHAEGYEAMTVDWRDVNLLASRFWPRRGFRPTYFRLYRHIP